MSYVDNNENQKKKSTLLENIEAERFLSIYDMERKSN